MPTPSRFPYPVLLVIAATAFFAHFFYLHEFGFYEDDYWATVPFIGEKLSAIPTLLSEAFSLWPQGRPLNHSLPKIQAILGMHLGGIGGIYLLAYVGFTLNCYLVFALLRRLFPIKSALVGTLVYIVFPADVTRPFLVHAAHVQGGMTFFLLGGWLWLKGGKWRLFSYAVAALSLTAYETAFLPFLTIPLFVGDSFRSTWRVLARHLAICALAILAFGIFRLTRGESRAVGALGDPLTSISHILSSLFLGPWTSGTRLIVAPLEGLERLDPTAWVCASLLVAGVFLTFSWLPDSRIAMKSAQPRPPQPLTGCFYLLGCAALTWAGSYALTLTNYPPTQTLGRLTSTHTAAAWGAALFMSALAACLVKLPLPIYGRRICATLGLVYLFGAIGFNQWVQREYARSWHLQQAFWQQVVTLCPDVVADWTIIVTGPPEPTSKVIATNSWADVLACRCLFSVPMNFAHLGYLGTATNIHREGGTILWTPEYWGGPVVKLDEQKLILLQSDGKNLVRVTVTQSTAGVLHGRPQPAAKSPVLSSPLAQALLMPAPSGD